MNWWLGVTHLLDYQNVSGSIPGVGNFCAGKGTIPENSGLGTRTLTHFQIFRVGVWEFLEKLRSGNRYTIQIFKNHGELRAIAKVYSAHRRKLYSRPGKV